MGKLPSEIRLIPDEDLQFLMAALVCKDRYRVALIERMSQEEKLTPEVYANLAKDLL